MDNNRFIAAAMDGNEDILARATRKDLNYQDEDGRTPTIWAALSGNLSALRRIVGREGDVNKCDFHGMTALHHAAMRGHFDVVSFLVNWGCNIYCLDNERHSALDLASLKNHDNIIDFLDKELDRKRMNDPKTSKRQKEKAIREAEKNQKEFEKMQDAASKRAEREQKRNDRESRPGIFKTITLRIKGSSNNSGPSVRAESNFSAMAGLSSTRYSNGVAKKLQARRNNEESSTWGRSEFKVSEMDPEGNRTLRSVPRSEGVYGTVSGVMYRNSKNSRLTEDDIGVAPKHTAPDMFPQKIYRAKSESDLLDSGVDSYNGDYEDDEDTTSPTGYNHGFGRLSFLPKNHMFNTIQSFDQGSSPHSRFDGDAGDIDDLDDIDSLMTPRPGSYRGSSGGDKLPWNLDDVDGLDENDDIAGINTKLSGVEMFLSSHGLTDYLNCFAREDIDLHLLMKMTEPDLQGIGLPWGPRKKLVEAIYIRKMALETPSKMIDTRL